MGKQAKDSFLTFQSNMLQEKEEKIIFFLFFQTLEKTYIFLKKFHIFLPKTVRKSF